MINWTEEDIRAELRRMDGITGLAGAELPIRFTYSHSTLGRFCGDVNRQPEHFEFSLHYFHGARFTRQAALDVIRHEYAHYMDCVLYGNFGHGPTWKLCCHKVGASPSRLYTKEYERATQFFEDRERASRKRSTFSVGQKLLHEGYGMGVIQAITPSGSTQLLTVEFDGATKILEAGWAEKNCAY